MNIKSPFYEELGKDSHDMKKTVEIEQDSEWTGQDIPTYAPPAYNESTSVSISPVPDLIARPAKLLTIQAHGTRCCRMPTPSNELEICIFDGTDTAAEPLYVSTRASRRSGNSVLRHSHMGDLLATTYKFGPGREPKISYLNSGSDVKFSQDDEVGRSAVKTKSHCWSYKVDLTMVDRADESFNWQYMKTTISTGKARVLALVKESPSASSSQKGGKVLAVLLRTDGTRTPGTRKSDAGNGGQLILASEAVVHMDESLIVASCIMMLKKEIDRQRGSQIAVMAAAAS